jgi:hypothetical protein
MAQPAKPAGAGPGSPGRIRATTGGFILSAFGTEAKPWEEGHFASWVEEPEATVDHAWFRGQSFDQMQRVWDHIASGECSSRDPDSERNAPGASLFVPFKIAPGEAKTIVVYLAWYVPRSDLFEPSFKFVDGAYEAVPRSTATYQPWYAGRFASIDAVKKYWQSQYHLLRQAAGQFSRAFYDSTLPVEVVEAVAANLTILKSPTVLRQIDGRLWGWEGSYDQVGSCYGSSNHVWNYAQALAHLFPSLERGLRETEFGPNQGSDGFQAIRAALPIRPIGDTREDAWGFPAAADGQLGGIIKVYREWRISGDTEWLRNLWPRIRASLDYCIKTWDPCRRGRIEEPHVNTYDVEWWGADSMCTSVYIGALRSAVLIGKALRENIQEYSALLSRAVSQFETSLFNGEYFVQKTEWNSLGMPFPPHGDGPLSARLREYPEMVDIAREEGPPYQYGQGCLSDGVFGAWMALVCDLGEILDRRKIESHLLAVYRYNFKKTLINHENHFRSFFACGEEGGLVLCSWPNGGRPALPFFFADEVWTGVEYQVASHLVALGWIDEGREIIQACRRRYDGRVRNPFAEVEAGYWYARSMSSYALLQAFSGARFDAVDRILYLQPVLKGDFRCFLCTATGFGTVGVKNKQPFVEVLVGEIPYREIRYKPQ